MERKGLEPIHYVNTTVTMLNFKQTRNGSFTLRETDSNSDSIPVVGS